MTNTSEEGETDGRKYRRQRSREGSITNNSSLHSIVEEDKKKVSPSSEKLPSKDSLNSSNSSESTTPQYEDETNKQTIYIRPLEHADNIPTSIIAKHNSSIYIRPDSDPLSSLEDQPSIPRRIRRTYLSGETNNKIEIDSDNIETPPTVRKNFNLNLKNLKSNQKSSDDHGNSFEQKGGKLEQEVLGDGQFDRFSSARRTRRFKRPNVDLSSATEDNTNTNATTTSPDSTSDASFSILIPSTTVPTSPEDTNTPLPSLKTEVEANKSKDIKNKANSDVVSRIGKIGKSISRISQEDVREAIRSLKSPTPERDWNVRDSFRNATNAPTNKIISHELNDEGFEETQSLVSDTPSLTTSSCNEEAKTKKESSPGASSNLNSTVQNEVQTKRRTTRPSNQLQTLLTRNQQSLERSRSLRTTPASLSSGARSATSTPRRTNSLRRPDHLQPQLTLPKPIANKRLDVERSNSRTSLRSSRSSLNSAVSTNTVKKMPVKPVVASSSSSSNLPKRPLISQNNSTSQSNSARSIPRIPASRSSSSGSSIGPSGVKKPPTPSKFSSSFKENQSNRSKVSPASSATSSKTTSSANALRSSPSNRIPSSSSFMRPTTASATKVKSK